MATKRISCFAHTLQLCIKDGIKDCKQLQHLLLKVVAHICRSTIATEQLEEAFQRTLRVNDGKADCGT